MHCMDEIYRSYSVPLYRYLCVLTGSTELAEELTQETFCEAVRCIERYDGSCRMLTWLCQIARHKWFDHLKRKKRRGNADERLAAVHLISEHHSLERNVELRQEAERLGALIRALPPQQREIVLLRVEGELSFRQIGELLGISENAARVTFFRAKKQLVQQMEREVDG